jgi:hypothetical protein
LKASAVVVMLLKIFWVVARLYTFLPKTLKMGQTSDPETLVIHQKLTPGNNPKKFKQQINMSQYNYLY